MNEKIIIIIIILHIFFNPTAFLPPSMQKLRLNTVKTASGHNRGKALLTLGLEHFKFQFSLE